MWNVNDLIVLSDLHLAAERDTGSFRSDRELTECLRWILKETRNSVTVLAGDTFEFMLTGDNNGSAGFDRFGSHISQIIKHHPEIFDALNELVRSPSHQLVIMAGDHDSELILPNVRETVERRLEVDFFNPKIHWLVQEEAFRVRVGSATVVVEHGNALDPWNRIDDAGLQNVLSLGSRNLFDISDLQQPLGSSLRSTVMRSFRSRYHWIDCLKPATGNILPLLWYVGSATQQEEIKDFADKYRNKKEPAQREKIGNIHNPTALYRGGKEAEEETEFEEWSTAIPGQNGNAAIKESLLGKLRKVVAQDTFFEIDEPDDSVKYLQPVFDGGADLIIHGHTHAAKILTLESGVHLNTGTWSQLLPLPKSYESDDVWRQFLHRLSTDAVESFSRPTLAQVQHHLNNDVTTATLLEWQPMKPTVLGMHKCGKHRKEN